MNKTRLTQLRHRTSDDPVLRHKEHVDLMAAAIFARSGYSTMPIEVCIQRAMEIIDLVDKLVDRELEETGHKIGVR